MARKPMDVQSVIVDASRYSLEEAKAKVKKMGYKVTKVDKPKEGETQEHYRFRQRDPGQFEKFRYHKLKRKTKDGEEETGVQLVLAKSFHILVKAVGHKYLQRIMTPTGYRYIYEGHPATKQATPAIEHKGSDAARSLASVIRRSHSAVGKHISEKAHDAVLAAKFHGKRKAKEHLDKIEQVHAEHRKKLGAAIEDARGKGKITHAEAMRLRKYQDKHGGSLANAIEHLKGLMRDPKSALAQKSFSLATLDKAVGAGGRPHKYVKRVPKAGGGFRYVYAKEGKREPKAPRANVRGKEMSADEAGHALNHKMMVVEQHIRRNEFTDVRRETDRMEDITQAFRGVRGVNVIPWENKIYNLRWKAEEKKREVAEERKKMPSIFRDIPPRELSQMVARPPEKETAKKSFTEDNSMDEELSLSEREGARIAMEVRGGEDALVEKMVKAASTEGGLEKAAKSEKQEHAMASNLVNEKFGKEASVRQAKPGLWVVAHGGKVLGKGKSPMAAYKAALKSKTQKSFSAEEIAVAAALGESPDALVKAVLEVPVHGKTKKKSIPDERLLAIFKAHVRTEYRNASRYNEGTNAQSIYDRILSSAEYNHHVEAALGLLEKLKTPFSIDFVKQCIQEIEDAQKEADQVAPEPTEPSSVIASGG